MLTYFSPSTCFLYRMDVYDGAVPEDAVAVSDEEYAALQAGISIRKILVPGPDGRPQLGDPAVEPPTPSALCNSIDFAADTARQAVAGDPLRAVEYDRARIEAEHYAAAGYQGEVPPMVAAWAINGRTPQQAADSILAEAAQYTAALVFLRTVRLNAKELIRNAMDAGEVAQAEHIAAETIASIQAAVAGIGNNAGV